MGAMKEFAHIYYRYAMRAAARATWSTIKYIDGIEDLNKKYQTAFERDGK